MMYGCMIVVHCRVYSEDEETALNSSCMTVWCLLSSNAGRPIRHINPLISTLKLQSNGCHIAVQWLVHWPLMGGLLHLVQQGGDWVGPQPAQAVPNVAAHPPTTSVPTSYYLMWHYNCLWSLKG